MQQSDRLLQVQKCAEVEQWVNTELAKQERMPLNVDPALTKAVLQAKAKELDGLFVCFFWRVRKMRE